MAEDSWPSVTHDDVVEDEYERLASMTGGRGATGLFGTPADTAVIYADGSGRVVKSRANRFANVQGFAWWSGSTDTTVSIAANSSGQTRIDLIVLRLDRDGDWDVRIAVKAGTPGSGPPSADVTLSDTGVYEFALAEVTVVNGASVINSGNVKFVAYFIGAQPVLCTSTTRPAHFPGLVIYEADTGRTYTSTGASWGTTIDDSGWVATGSPTNSFTTGGFASVVRRVNGVVYCRPGWGQSATTISTGSPPSGRVFLIPSGFRPTYTQWFMGMTSAGVLMQFRINALTATNEGAVTLELFTGTIGAGSALRMNDFSYPLG